MKGRLIKGCFITMDFSGPKTKYILQYYILIMNERGGFRMSFSISTYAWIFRAFRLTEWT